MPVFAFRVTLLLLFMVVGIAFGAGLATVRAQPETGECELNPLTLPLFDATPAVLIAATPNASTVAGDTSDEAILAAVEEIVDCINTGDAAYQYAIFTGRYLAEQFADPSATYQPAFELQLSLGPADVEETFALTGISEVTVRDDGRVSVVVELSAGGSTYRDTLVLANVDGTWLIDSIEDLDPAP